MRTIEKHVSKSSFLVFTQHKYIMVPTDTIALFYIKYTASMIVCFDRREYGVGYSLDNLQRNLPEEQFFRLNRQVLVSFQAVKEVEHYFARKLCVELKIPFTEKLLVPREKASAFLRWLENR